MSVASRITSMTEHIQNAYDSIERFGVNTESIDKNLVNLSNTITNEIYDKLPKVSGNGSNFTLESVQKGKLDLFEMEGNTHQDSYSGINLLDTNSISVNSPVTNLTVSSDETGIITINGSSFTGNLNLKTNLSKSLNGTYTLIFKKISGSISDNGVNFRYSIGNPENPGAASTAGRLLSNIFNGNSEIVVTTETINDTLDKFNMYFNPNAIFTNFKFVIYLVEGTYTSENIPNYEPYVGGTSSPNPDYPQEVKVVKGNNTINVHGKNLFDKVNVDWYRNNNSSFSNTTDTSAIRIRTTSFAIQGGKTYTLSGIPTGISILSVRTYSTNSGDSIGNATLSNNKFTLNNDVNYIHLLFQGENFTSDTNILMKNANIQIEQGSTATAYEPYHNQDYEIDLGDIELCKIGDYKDVIFKNNQLSSYYDSTLDEDSWYIKKNIGKVVVDTSNITLRSNYTNIEYAEITKPNDFIGNGNYGDYNVYCSHAISDIKNAAQYAWDSTYRIGKITNKATAVNLWLGFPKNTGLDNIKTVLNGAVIYYTLATPTYEKITNETLISQLEAIETETGTNIFEVSNDNDVLPSINVKRLKELEKLS